MSKRTKPSDITSILQLEEARTSRNLTVRQACERMGLGYDMLRRYELGHFSPKSAPYRVVMAYKRVLKVPVKRWEEAIALELSNS